MRERIHFLGTSAAFLLVLFTTGSVPGQDAAQQALQQKIAALKQSMADNQAKLRQYSWTETTEISLKGEVKKREQNECRYGADGKVQKTPIGDSGGQQAKGAKRGLKGKIVANKVDEMKDYMDRVGSLVKRYVPPDPDAMQASFQSGKALLDKASGSLTFTDYAKPGDRVTLSFDTAAKKLRVFSVNTYLDSPQDTVTLTARFSSLPDGVNFLEETVLNAAAKEIQIRTTNFGHQK
jgi:hypothetical protein